MFKAEWMDGGERRGGKNRTGEERRKEENRRGEEETRGEERHFPDSRLDQSKTKQDQHKAGSIDTVDKQIVR